MKQVKRSRVVALVIVAALDAACAASQGATAIQVRLAVPEWPAAPEGMSRKDSSEDGPD